MSSGNWSELLHDLLVMIVKRIESIEDFFAFRGVCVSWQAAATKDNFNRTLSKIPLLILPERGDRDDRELFSVSKSGVLFSIPLPEAKGKKCLESRGWLITVGGKGEMHLLHPFSRVQIELPNISTIEGFDAEYHAEWCHTYVGRASLSCSPFESSDYAVVISSWANALDFWKPGNKAWTRITLGRTQDISDINFFRGQFYVANYFGETLVCDLSGSNGFRARITAEMNDPEIFAEMFSVRQTYLLESSGEILLITRDGIFSDLDDNGEPTYGAAHFDVFQVDISNRGMTVIKSLGDRSVFVGHNTSFSVDAKAFPGTIKPNCIYFTDDSVDAYLYTKHGGGKDMGVYHLEDGRIERFLDLQSFSKISLPVWLVPYF